MRIVQIQQAGSRGRAFSILAWAAEESMVVHRTALHGTPTVYQALQCWLWVQSTLCNEVDTDYPWGLRVHWEEVRAEVTAVGPHKHD